MDNTEKCCLAKILNVIDILQKECSSECCPEGCERPFLGTSLSSTYNTRVITLYGRTGELFSVTYYVNNVANESTTFRVEDVNNCCAKLRILVANDDGSYTSTNEFVTVNLECFCILRCLGDTSIDF